MEIPQYVIAGLWGIGGVFVKQIWDVYKSVNRKLPIELTTVLLSLLLASACAFIINLVLFQSNLVSSLPAENFIAGVYWEEILDKLKQKYNKDSTDEASRDDKPPVK